MTQTLKDALEKRLTELAEDGTNAFAHGWNEALREIGEFLAEVQPAPAPAKSAKPCGMTQNVVSRKALEAMLSNLTLSEPRTSTVRSPWGTGWNEGFDYVVAALGEWLEWHVAPAKPAKPAGGAKSRAILAALETAVEECEALIQSRGRNDPYYSARLDEALHLLAVAREICGLEELGVRQQSALAVDLRQTEDGEGWSWAVVELGRALPPLASGESRTRAWAESCAEESLRVISRNR